MVVSERGLIIQNKHSIIWVVNKSLKYFYAVLMYESSPDGFDFLVPGIVYWITKVYVKNCRQIQIVISKRHISPYVIVS